ncbi:DNA-directed RNA polymerase I subunit RPA34 isoform X1 [Xenopus laevis]|nr:DNA-directed RNA polymerase I subunit RPA34 isoform X1 [Xenopus laevis]
MWSHLFQNAAVGDQEVDGCHLLPLKLGGKERFECPLNFKPMAVYDGTMTSDPDLEVWLIKAPADFNPESFTNHRFPLAGCKSQKVKVDGVRRLYSVAAAPCTDTPCRALLPQDNASGDRLVCAPLFQGVITISDAHGDSSAVHPIPDRQPRAVPEGLKLRYSPFGSVNPSNKRKGEEAIVHTTKKKKKKRKRVEENVNV